MSRAQRSGWLLAAFAHRPFGGKAVIAPSRDGTENSRDGAGVSQCPQAQTAEEQRVAEAKTAPGAMRAFQLEHACRDDDERVGPFLRVERPLGPGRDPNLAPSLSHQRRGGRWKPWQISGRKLVTSMIWDRSMRRTLRPASLNSDLPRALR